VLRRGVPVGLAVTAALADVASAPALAFYALVLAVPFAAAAALSAYGELVDAAEAGRERRYERLQTALSTSALAFLVIGGAARAPAVGEGVVPAFAISSLAACLLALLVQAVSAGAAQMREPVRAPGTG
jgi:hypothetical protein